MASDSDRFVFESALAEQDNTPLFQAKRWTSIIDGANSGGTFSSQLQFDLNTLSSQNQWTDLSQAYIQFPVKLSISCSAAAATGTCTINAATIKNGFHHFVDSVQIVLGGSTIQSSQIFENVNASYKMLTEWSRDEYEKFGPTLGLGLDDIQYSTDTSIGIAESFDNAAIVSSGEQGLDYTVPKNPGHKKRLVMFNNGTDINSHFGRSILGTNQISLGKGNVQAADNTVTTANSERFVFYALGVIRLKDLSDAISKLPPIKNMKGFIYVNYNASQHVLTNANGSSNITAVSNTAIYGRCAPAFLDVGTGFLPNATTGGTSTFRAEISGVATSGTTLTTAAPITTTARLVAPYYVANVEVDRALSQKKTIRYHERFTTQFSIAANGQFNGTLSPGITNPKRVILLPYFTGPGNSGNSKFLTNPLLSFCDIVGSGSSPFAALSQLQILVGSQPMFQQPITYDYDTFINEVSQLGYNGGQEQQATSGVLDQRLWNQMYRYYTCDVSRRMVGDDGASKSVQVSCTNATNCPMTIIANIWYEREIVIDTAMGTITQQM